MSLTVLQKAVEDFIQATYRLSESDLDKSWAWETYDVEGLRYALFRTYEELCELSVNVAAERADFGITTIKVQQILAPYHTAYRDLQAVLLDVGNVADHSPSKDVWPLREVIAHIIFAEYRPFVAVWKVLDEQSQATELPLKIGPVIDYSLGSDLNDRKSFSSLLYGQFAGILAYYDGLHKLILQKLANIDSEQLSLLSPYWKGFEVTIQFHLHRFDSHLRQHIIQIEKTLNAIGQHPSEAKQILRLVYRALAEVENSLIGAEQIGERHCQEVAGKISARTTEIIELTT
jgi:hypothetical protein